MFKENSNVLNVLKVTCDVLMLLNFYVAHFVLKGCIHFSPRTGVFFITRKDKHVHGKHSPDR